MSLAAALGIEVGTSIAKSILKLWLKDSSIASDVSESLIDILKSKTSDRIAQKRASRQLEAIGEKVGESLLSLFDAEGANLDEGSRTAVALAVAETLNRISSGMVVKGNLEPSQLARHLLKENPAEKYYFGEKETLLYQRIISESCEYIVDIASQLPMFTEHTFAEVLKRERELLLTAEKVLQEVHRMSEQLDSRAEATRFELDYRRAVVRKLDELHLFGADVSSTSRRHSLSVAYVTLLVEQKSSETQQYKNTKNRKSKTSLRETRTKESIIQELQYKEVNEKEIHNYTNLQDFIELQNLIEAQGPELKENLIKNAVVVDDALVDASRLLIRGLAGSGKTTLLQWIAINSASRTFKGKLDHWNDTVPFYISLRQCAQVGLPAPEAFPKFITVAISDTMPKGWVHKVLDSKRAIVLIDGLDEITEEQRKDVQIWLKDLIRAYPDARYIATSRPHAVKEDWMENENFSDAELQPMDLSNIHAFIDNWHKAVGKELVDNEEKEDLQFYAEYLKKEVEYNHSKRNLATNPLLCAMLCALNRERRQHLPSDRLELYEACCQLLIERRDAARRILLTDYPAIALTYRQKCAFLEDLAYWLVRNNWSEVETEQVDDRFAQKLINIRNMPQNISGSDIRRFFVERSGIIREPAADYIDFAHRTFQEFFAAKAIIKEGDVGVLKHNAHKDQWREIIILASGIANRRIREKIIYGLINRGDVEIEHSHQLHLLAVSCLETPIEELKQELKIEVEKRLNMLIPPHNLSDVNALVAAGELAVPYLARKGEYSASVITSCIQTLAFIGGETALDMLESYASDRRQTTVHQLIWAWELFDREDYARRILSQVLLNTFNAPIHLPSLRGFQYLVHLTSLSLCGCQQISDLSALDSLIHLKSLNLSYCGQVSDLRPLAKMISLRELDLSGCKQIRDLNDLTKLTQLKKLHLWGCKQIDDIYPLANLANLEMLPAGPERHSATRALSWRKTRSAPASPSGEKLSFVRYLACSAR